MVDGQKTSYMYATCLVGTIIYPSKGANVCIHFITSFKPSNNKGCHDVFLFRNQILKLNSNTHRLSKLMQTQIIIKFMVV
jgi:hypothetical protein